jgi:hypothetical protein
MPSAPFGDALAELPDVDGPRLASAIRGRAAHVSRGAAVSQKHVIRHSAQSRAKILDAVFFQGDHDSSLHTRTASGRR